MNTKKIKDFFSFKDILFQNIFSHYIIAGKEHSGKNVLSKQIIEIIKNNYNNIIIITVNPDKFKNFVLINNGVLVDLNKEKKNNKTLLKIFDKNKFLLFFFNNNIEFVKYIEELRVFFNHIENKKNILILIDNDVLKLLNIFFTIEDDFFKSVLFLFKNFLVEIFKKENIKFVILIDENIDVNVFDLLKETLSGNFFFFVHNKGIENIKYCFKLKKNIILDEIKTSNLYSYIFWLNKDEDIFIYENYINNINIYKYLFFNDNYIIEEMNKFKKIILMNQKNNNLSDVEIINKIWHNIKNNPSLINKHKLLDI